MPLKTHIFYTLRYILVYNFKSSSYRAEVCLLDSLTNIKNIKLQPLILAAFFALSKTLEDTCRHSGFP